MSEHDGKWGIFYLFGLLGRPNHERVVLISDDADLTDYPLLNNTFDGEPWGYWTVSAFDALKPWMWP